MNRKKRSCQLESDPWGHRDPYNLPALDSRMLLKYLRFASNGLEQVEALERSLGHTISRTELEGRFGFDPLAFAQVDHTKIITVAEIKAELAKRPHVMRRLERAAARRTAALMHRGQKKSRNR